MDFDKLPTVITSPITGNRMILMSKTYPNNSPNVVATDYDGDLEVCDDEVAMYKNEEAEWEVLYVPYKN